MFYPLPINLPIEECKYILDAYYKGTQAKDFSKTFHAGWVIIGYGKSKFGSELAVSLDDYSLENDLHHISNIKEGGIIAINWQKLVNAIFKEIFKDLF